MTDIERKMIPLDKVVFNPYQPRTIFDEEEIANLAISLEANTQLTPLGVYQYEDIYIVHDGDRRVRAARKLGWKEIRAEIYGVLKSLDQKDPMIIEMREKADQANNQRVGITRMERARSRLALFDDSIDKYKEAGGKGYAGFARQLGVSSAIIDREINAAIEERELKKIIVPVNGANPTEDPRHYTITREMKIDPQTRWELLELAGTLKDNDGYYYLKNHNKLREATKAIASAPELKNYIIECIKDGKDTAVLQGVSEVSVGLEAETRKALIALRYSEKIREDELLVMSQVLKETPELAEYAFALKERGQSVENVKTSIDYVKTLPQKDKTDVIEAGIVFTRSMEVPTVTLSPHAVEELSRMLLQIRQEDEERERDPIYQKFNKLVQNWLAHGHLVSNDTGFCPKCGTGKGHLVWSCCGMSLRDAHNMASEQRDKIANEVEEAGL